MQPSPSTKTIDWLLGSGEPWTRYRVWLDLLDQADDSPPVVTARDQMLASPQVRHLIAQAASWPGYALQRHNDARHPIYALSTLADFGLRLDDPGASTAVEAVLAHQSPEGSFQTQLNVARSFGGTGQDQWAWMLCDAPTVLYALIRMGLREDRRVRRAVDHLVSLVDDNGWHCTAGSEMGRFRGPGRRSDPCPIANVYALKALSQVPELLDSPAAHQGAEMLLSHWERRGAAKFYLFGIGTEFRKLKYPFVWYDILHVADVVCRLPFVRADSRFREMLESITSQADEHGRYRATSVYQAWRGWSFADKKNPSPWLTFLALRVMKRSSE